MTLILIMAACAVVSTAILTAFMLHDTTEDQGFIINVILALVVWTLVAIAGGGLIFGLIRLVRLAWGEP